MSRFAIAVLICLASLAYVHYGSDFAQADDLQPPPPPLAGEVPFDADAIQDLIVMLDPPVFIRVQLEVDGIPYRRHWRQHIQALHDVVDTNADGVLTIDEIDVALVSQSTPIEAKQLLQDPALWSCDLLPVDRVLTADELVLAAEMQTGGPFQETQSTSANSPNLDVNFVQGGTGKTPGQVLFETLDLDGNGRLTSEEIDLGRESLRRLDFDVDGNASLSEMEYTRNPFQGQTQFGASSEAVPVQVIDRSGKWGSLIEQLMRRFGGEPTVGRGERTLSANSLGIPQRVFENYDHDGNDQLDRREIRSLLADPPVAIAMTVRVGSRAPGQPMVEVHSTEAWGNATVRTTPAGIASLIVDGFQIEILAGQSSAGQFVDFFKAIFSGYDRDANAYLEPDEVQGGQLEGVFERFDLNHDQMLYEDEMLAVVEAESAAAVSRSRLVPSNRGRDLFEILDENRDRRISPRELASIVLRIGIWDENGDAALTQSEIPQLYQLSFDRGQPDFPGVIPQGVVTVVPAPGIPAAVTTDGPVWYQRMDRNNDGDVSRREFLGTPDQFNELDLNGDELISPQEAARKPDRAGDAQ